MPMKAKQENLKVCFHTMTKNFRTMKNTILKSILRIAQSLKIGRKTDSESKKVEENWTRHGVRYVNINKVLNGKLGQKFNKIMSIYESKL